MHKPPPIFSYFYRYGFMAGSNRSGYLFSLGKEIIVVNCKNSPRTLATEVKRNLTIDTLNPQIKEMQYAVRGPIVKRALEIEAELKKFTPKPFKEVIKANLGNAHALGQTPITFIRQMLALVSYPDLIEDPRFPDDVKDRACDILDACLGGSVGSYSNSMGIQLIRQHVADYIERRDLYASDWQDIVLAGGASDGIKRILQLFVCEVDGKQPGVLIPIPQYPLYSATLSEYGLQPINYYLNESKHWAVEISELQRAYKESAGCHARAIVVINPGNPTGQVFSKQSIEEVIKFAQEKGLFILADEVYQDNVYAEDCQFHSLKKVHVMNEMGPPYCQVELASFMSASKGYMGECGLRGGYVEVVNMCPDCREMYHKLLSSNLCANVLGQVVTDCFAKPPTSGEPSYDLFVKEKCEVLNSLRDRAELVADTFNTFEGFSCNPVQGAMYAFPQIQFPPKALEAAERAGRKPDVFYVHALLEKTGIVVVSGSGFGEKPGTYHFRTTILPQMEKLKSMMKSFDKFHSEFMAQYR